MDEMEIVESMDTTDVAEAERAQPIPQTEEIDEAEQAASVCLDEIASALDDELRSEESVMNTYATQILIAHFIPMDFMRYTFTGMVFQLTGDDESQDPETKPHPVSRLWLRVYRDTCVGRCTHRYFYRLVDAQIFIVSDFDLEIELVDPRMFSINVKIDVSDLTLDKFGYIRDLVDWFRPQSFQFLTTFYYDSNKRFEPVSLDVYGLEQNYSAMLLDLFWSMIKCAKEGSPKNKEYQKRVISEVLKTVSGACFMDLPENPFRNAFEYAEFIAQSFKEGDVSPCRARISSFMTENVEDCEHDIDLETYLATLKVVVRSSRFTIRFDR